MQPARNDDGLNARILALLEHADYQPLDKAGIAKALDIHSAERRRISDALDGLERDGAIVCIRKDRYVLPETAQLFTGRIEFHRNSNAHVVGERRGEDDVFVTSINAGTSLHGDLVVVRLDDRATERREGRVIRIIERGTQRIVGTLQRSERFHYVVPDDPRMPHDVYVETTPAARIGYKVVVRLDRWESRHVNPEGTIVEVLGPAGAPGVDMLAIIRKHDLPERFPDAVLAEADRIAEEIDPEEIARREDCRGIDIVTIDPDDAKDFDDAIHVERLANGWRLQVHIADVSHYVTPGGELDNEAAIRGNSTYLVDRVIPMLPERLSNGICSLKPHVERLTFAAFIEFDKAGRPTHSHFARAIIRSAHRFTYKEAFAALQRKPGSAIDERLHTAWELASLLRKNRFAAGSLELDFPELKVRLDDAGNAVRIERIENDISHQLVEEFMLAANEAVASMLTRGNIPTVYRVHEKPVPTRLREFREIVATHGIRIGNPELRSELQKALRAVHGQPEELSVKLALLRRLMRARYDTQPLGHYGLAKGHYTHFTSPIRRYSDLIVHRSTAFAIARGKHDTKPQHMGGLGQIAAHISTTERTSSDAEFESVQLKKFDFFERQIASRQPQEFRAIVTEARSFGLIVELPDAGQSGVIHVSTLGDDFFQFDAVRQCFFSRRGRKRFSLGDELTVIVSRVDRFKRQVDFVPVA
ncbi:MAG: ribonuclease R [Chthoniobacteraceae bacterium]